MRYLLTSKAVDDESSPARVVRREAAWVLVAVDPWRSTRAVAEYLATALTMEERDGYREVLSTTSEGERLAAELFAEPRWLSLAGLPEDVLTLDELDRQRRE